MLLAPVEVLRIQHATCGTTPSRDPLSGLLCRDCNPLKRLLYRRHSAREVDNAGRSPVPDRARYLPVSTSDNGTLELEIGDHIDAIAPPLCPAVVADLMPDNARVVKAYAASYLGKGREVEQLLQRASAGCATNDQPPSDPRVADLPADADDLAGDRNLDRRSVWRARHS